MTDREELMDDLDAGVFSGDLLETDLEVFKGYVARWQRAIDEHEESIVEESIVEESIVEENMSSCPDCGEPIRGKELWEGGGIECSKKCGYWFCY